MKYISFELTMPEVVSWNRVDILQIVAKENYRMYENTLAENARLRKVVDAARDFISSTGCNPKECGKCDPKYINFCERSRIGQALAELDKER